jgi:hypothetical protein
MRGKTIVNLSDSKVTIGIGLKHLRITTTHFARGHEFDRNATMYVQCCKRNAKCELCDVQRKRESAENKIFLLIGL